MSGPGGKPTGVKPISKNTSDTASDLQQASIKQLLMLSCSQDTRQKKRNPVLNSGVIIRDNATTMTFMIIGFNLDC